MRTQKKIKIFNDKEQFILRMIKAEGVSEGASEFFIEILKHFEFSEFLISSSKKLAIPYGCSERTIQRYIKELSKSFNYIHVKPHYNNDNPDKPYIEYNTYSKTDTALKLESKAEGFAQRDENVNFKVGLFE
ncbi:MAG: hypothetical protein KQ78_00838 [Candidatus Izimaplasma bacterium HR2]|nr:MAG: hypothetical protein KQ78_00838 [Candidatus Izimaplasma bacterium HR2]